MKSAAIFGMGAIGTSLALDWNANPPLGWRLTAVCARARQAAELQSMLGSEIQVLDRLEEVLALSPDAVVETAGQASARTAACSILRSGSDLYLLSTGILASQEVLDEVLRAADEGDASVVLPAGALAGFDGLATLRRMKPATVVYRSTKPVRAWMGTLAEEQFDLAAMTSKTVIFRGTAREATLAYPQNANLAATVALAGIGFDDTQVELIADPDASRNSAEIECQTGHGALRVEMASQPEARNPKSSATVRSSIISALERSTSRLKLG